MTTQTLSQPFITACDNGITINIKSKLLGKLWPFKARTKEKGNARAVLKALEKARGILTLDHPDGVTYENQIRQEAEEHFKALNW